MKYKLRRNFPLRNKNNHSQSINRPKTSKGQQDKTESKHRSRLPDVSRGYTWILLVAVSLCITPLSSTCPPLLTLLSLISFSTFWLVCVYLSRAATTRNDRVIDSETAPHPPAFHKHPPPFPKKPSFDSDHRTC